MAIVGFIIEKDKKIDEFVETMNNKLQNPNMFNNPFVGAIKKDKDFILLYLRLIWINPVYIAFILTLTIILGRSYISLWFLALAFPFWLGAFAFTKTFTMIALYFSLKRIGYKGKIKFLNDTQLLMRLSNWDEKR
jgi:hypothetical protein